MKQGSFYEKSTLSASYVMFDVLVEIVRTFLDARSVKKDSSQADVTIYTLSSADCVMFPIVKNASRG